MKLSKMIKIYLKYDNMHTIVIINAFICIHNHVNLCIKCMLSEGLLKQVQAEKVHNSKRKQIVLRACVPGM